jgi:hypothetical protein
VGAKADDAVIYQCKRRVDRPGERNRRICESPGDRLAPAIQSATGSPGNRDPETQTKPK